MCRKRPRAVLGLEDTAADVAFKFLDTEDFDFFWIVLCITSSVPSRIQNEIDSVFISNYEISIDSVSFMRQNPDLFHF